jgi:hypothetical protein
MIDKCKKNYKSRNSKTLNFRRITAATLYFFSFISDLHFENSHGCQIDLTLVSMKEKMPV